jgi:hypothetical protein
MNPKKRKLAEAPSSSSVSIADPRCPVCRCPVGKNTPDEAAAYLRGMEIIPAWVAWKEAVAKGEERSGMAAANAADQIASDPVQRDRCKTRDDPSRHCRGRHGQGPRDRERLRRKRFGGRPSRGAPRLGA